MTTDRRSTKARPDTVNFLIEQRRTELRLHPPPDSLQFTPLSDRFTGLGGSTQSTSNKCTNNKSSSNKTKQTKQTKQIKQKYKQDEGLRQAIACARTAGRVCTPAAAGLALVLLNPACVLVVVGADERRLQQAAAVFFSSRSSSSGLLFWLLWLLLLLLSSLSQLHSEAVAIDYLTRRTLVLPLGISSYLPTLPTLPVVLT